MATRTRQAPLSVENRVELEALCNMIELAGGFALGIARVNHPALRERLVEAVKTRFSKKSIAEVTLERESQRGVVAQLDDALKDCQPGAVFVYGLEGMLDLSLAQSPAMDILNLNRNFFAKRFPWPILFWVPEFGMREISRQAPDFWSWRSGTYLFVGEAGDAARTLGTFGKEPVHSISLREKRERREILEHILAELEGEPRPERRPLADTYYLLGQACYYEDEGAAASHYFEQALPLFRALNDRLGEANCSQRLGQVAQVQGCYEEAAARYEQALAIYRQIGDRLGEADSIQSLGDVALRQGRYREAAGRYEQALSIFRLVGARVGEANCIQGLGDVALGQGRHEASARYQQALAIYQQIGNRLGEAECMYRLGEVARMQGRDEDVAGRYEQAALAIYRQIGDRVGEANCVQSLGEMARMQGRDEDAAGRYEQALAIYRQIGDRLGEARCIRSLGEVALGQGRNEEAAGRHEQALAIYRQIDDRLGEANTLLFIGGLKRRIGDEAGMRSALQQAAAIYESIGREDWAEYARAEATRPVA